jgi:formate dehydrogenase-N alpha subunit
MTQHWNDIGDSDCILVIGGNPAENHPVSMRHVQRAIDSGAKLISVDPRYTRTSAKAHYYAPMRSGTDIAFINGMINYAIQNNRCNQKYVLHYTNAGFLLRNDFARPGDVGMDGLFSGYSWPGSSPGKYNTASWAYATYNSGPNEFTAADVAADFWDSSGDCVVHGASCPGGFSAAAMSLEGSKGLAAYRAHLEAAGLIGLGSTLPNSGPTVWESIKAHYARYDVGTVSAITGCPVATLNQVYDEYTKTGQVGKAGTIMYAMGTTQHTVGTQNIRAYASLQLLLGNTGVRGGGINACRGESNVQGSTDHCLLFHILPGYLSQPTATTAGDAYFDRTDSLIGPAGHPNQLPSYIKRITPWAVHNPPGTAELNWWQHAKKYVVSLLKCYWGTQADSLNDFRYDWVPKLSGNHSHISIFEKMDAGDIKGLLCFGQNPAVGGPNSKLARRALRNLDWLIVSDLWETETAAFWRYNLQGNLDPAGAASINTEVLVLPAACHIEKDGSVVNSSRWTQFRYQANSVSPPGDARHEIEMLNEIYDAVRGKVGGVPAPGHMDEPLYHLCMGTWHYGSTNPSADYLDREINGYTIATGALLGSFGLLQADGSTSCGNWLYCGSYSGTLAGGGTNKAKNRDNTPGIAATYSNWAWSWPVNRRIIYNGASLVPDSLGRVTATSWDPTHPLLVWGGSAWTGDVNDGVPGPGRSTRGVFIMKNDGHGHLHGFTCVEGPYPEHYEPLENPFGVPDIKGKGPNPMGHGQLVNPIAKIWRPAEIGNVADYPIVGTTYRVTEHWQAGAQTRNLPWLVELVPDVFCEMSKQLAASLGVSNGDRVKVKTPRGKVKCYAVVTDRFKPFTVNGKTVHQIGVIWHFGYKGLATGHSGNILTPHIGDANTMIPEYKAFRCQVVKV